MVYSSTASIMGLHIVLIYTEKDSLKHWYFLKVDTLLTYHYEEIEAPDTHVHTHTHTHIHTHTYTHTHTHIPAHTYTHIHTHTSLISTKERKHTCIYEINKS